MTREHRLVLAVRRARRGRRGTAVRFGEQVREAVGALARERGAERGAVRALARELGLTYETLRRWSAAPPAAAIRRVRVARAEPEGSRSAAVVLLVPGIRVEGLSVEEVAELVRRLR